MCLVWREKSKLLFGKLLQMKYKGGTFQWTNHLYRNIYHLISFAPYISKLFKHISLVNSDTLIFIDGKDITSKSRQNQETSPHSCPICRSIIYNLWKHEFYHLYVTCVELIPKTMIFCIRLVDIPVWYSPNKTSFIWTLQFSLSDKDSVNTVGA